MWSKAVEVMKSEKTKQLEEARLKTHNTIVLTEKLCFVNEMIVHIKEKIYDIDSDKDSIKNHSLKSFLNKKIKGLEKDRTKLEKLLQENN